MIRFGKKMFFFFRFDERKVLIFVGISFMIIGRIVMFPISGTIKKKPLNFPKDYLKLFLFSKLCEIKMRSEMYKIFIDLRSFHSTLK